MGIKLHNTNINNGAFHKFRFKKKENSGKMHSLCMYTAEVMRVWRRKKKWKEGKKSSAVIVFAFCIVCTLVALDGRKKKSIFELIAICEPSYV